MRRDQASLCAHPCAAARRRTSCAAAAHAERETPSVGQKRGTAFGRPILSSASKRILPPTSNALLTPVVTASCLAKRSGAAHGAHATHAAVVFLRPAAPVRQRPPAAQRARACATRRVHTMHTQRPHHRRTAHIGAPPLRLAAGSRSTGGSAAHFGSGLPRGARGSTRAPRREGEAPLPPRGEGLERKRPTRRAASLLRHARARKLC